jgi:hypothetical protein
VWARGKNFLHSRPLCETLSAAHLEQVFSDHPRRRCLLIVHMYLALGKYVGEIGGFVEFKSNLEYKWHYF